MSYKKQDFVLNQKETSSCYILLVNQVICVALITFTLSLSKISFRVRGETLFGGGGVNVEKQFDIT